jgi:signal-transduction protein with cAMP-binding, CBS, and nucleotidyltransferase domain
MASAPREAWGDLATTAFVESSILFRSLDPEARRDLLQLAHVVDYAAGEPVSESADDGFLLVSDGAAAVLAEGGSGPVQIAQLERGALFGEGRVLGTGRASALAALTDLRVVVFPAAVIGAVAERFPKVKKLLEAVQAAREKEAAAKLAG